MLLISHDRECLQLCDEVFELSNRGLSRFGGSWFDYIEHRDRERARLRAALVAVKRERDVAHAHRREQQARQERRNRLGARAATKGGAPKILLGARKRRAEVSTGKLEAATSQQANDAVRRAYEAYARLKVDPLMNAELFGAPLPSQKLVAEAHGFNIRLRDWLCGSDLDFPGEAMYALPCRERTVQANPLC